MEQRFTFNSVAAQYDAARPSYPEALFDNCITEAELKTGERILEVGSGTGKATAGFARHGFPILALEPGGQMIATAKRSLAQFENVAFLETTFEAWTPEASAFGLVASAQAWHWVDPKVSFLKAAQALRPDGALAVFGNVPIAIPAPLEEAFRAIFLRHVPDQPPPTVSGATVAYQPNGPFPYMFDASGLFGPVRHRQYNWRWPHTTASYIAHQHTISGFLIMPADLREAILTDTARAIDSYGGAFDMEFETHIYMAHRK